MDNGQIEKMIQIMTYIKNTLECIVCTQKNLKIIGKILIVMKRYTWMRYIRGYVLMRKN